MVSTDYFSYAGKSFFIVVDRYSGWLSIYRAGKDGALGLIQTMKEYFSTFGIAQQVTSDGGPQYTSQMTRKFFKDWGVCHRITSSYFPHANTRAELGVKSAKRMLRENIGLDGNLRTDQFLRALMIHRNTPDRDTGLSPAQVIFGRATRNFFPIKPGNYQPRQEWRISMQQRELALAQRHVRKGGDLAEHTKKLAPLGVGQVVLIQNQSGKNPRRWERSGQVVEVLAFDQYRIKVDGSGRISLRNRRFLRPITPYNRIETGTQDGQEGADSVEPPLGDSLTKVPRRSERVRHPPQRYGIGVINGSRSSQEGGHRRAATYSIQCRYQPTIDSIDV